MNLDMNLDTIMSPQFSLLLPLLIPLTAALLVLVSHKRANVREGFTLISGVALILSVASLLPLLSDDKVHTLSVVLAEPLPGIALALNLEPLGFLFAGLAAFLWLVTSCYSIGYMRGLSEHNQTRFYCFIALAIASTMGIALSANLFTLFVFYELLTLVTFPLVSHKGTAAAKRAGRIYLGLLMGASIVLLMPAIIWTWSIAGTLDFKTGGILAGKATSVTLRAFWAICFWCGKSGTNPLTPMVASSDGRSNARECVIACSGGGKGRCFHHSENIYLYL